MPIFLLPNGLQYQPSGPFRENVKFWNMMNDFVFVTTIQTGFWFSTHPRIKIHIWWTKMTEYNLFNKLGLNWVKISSNLNLDLLQLRFTRSTVRLPWVACSKNLSYHPSTPLLSPLLFPAYPLPKTSTVLSTGYSYTIIGRFQVATLLSRCGWGLVDGSGNNHKKG